jgi:hypothetical protein
MARWRRQLTLLAAWLAAGAVLLVGGLAALLYLDGARVAFAERHVVFYGAHQAEVIEPIVEQIDALAREVEDRLGVQPSKERTYVFASSAEGTAGQHAGGFIALDADRQSLEQLASTFQHETAHRCVFLIMGEGADPRLRQLNEGLASYVELALRGNPATGVAAAVASSVGADDIALAMDPEAAARIHRPFTGEVLASFFVRALVETAGPDAPLRVFRRWKRSPPPSAMNAGEATAEVMKQEGFSLDETRSAYRRLIDAAVKDNAAFLAMVPRPTATPTDDPLSVAVGYAFATGQAPGEVEDGRTTFNGLELELGCAVRMAGGPPTDLPLKNGRCALPASARNRGDVELQVFWRAPAISVTFARRWTPFAAPEGAPPAAPP